MEIHSETNTRMRCVFFHCAAAAAHFGKSVRPMEKKDGWTIYEKLAAFFYQKLVLLLSFSSLCFSVDYGEGGMAPLQYLLVAPLGNVKSRKEN